MNVGASRPAGEPGPEPEDDAPASETDELSDAELVARQLAGDPGAFEQIVERYERLVFKVSYSKANDVEDATDITQEIFLHVHRSLPKLRDPQAFLGWLLSIAHNRANRYCRTRQSRRRRLEEVQRRAAEENERTLRRQQRGDEEDAAGVGDVVADLEPEYRDALTWKYVEGLSYEEIGDRLSMSFHQVDYLLRRAKRALRVGLERQRLDEREEDSGPPAEPRMP